MDGLDLSGIQGALVAGPIVAAIVAIAVTKAGPTVAMWATALVGRVLGRSK